MTSTNGMDPTGLPLAPTPNRERFRLRVEVFLPQDAHSYNAKPYHSFIIAKSRSLKLPELSLRELRDVVVYRYKTIYPNETLFQISKTTNALGDDLFLDDSVGDIFADNEVFRVIKGASIRESLPRNYRETREASVQPIHQPNDNTRKRSPNTSNMGDLSRTGKRQRFHEPERPIPSIERFAVIDEEDEGPQSGAEDEDIPDAEEPSQEEVEAPQGADVDEAHAAEVVASHPVAQTAAVQKERPGRQPKAQSMKQTPSQPTPTSGAQDMSSLIDGETPAVETATKKKGKGRRARKSLSAAPIEQPAESKTTPISTSPILPATVTRGMNGALATSVSFPLESLSSLGTARSSQMLPPPIIPQRQPPRPISPPKAADAAQNSAPASSPNSGAGTVAKRGRRVSFAEPKSSRPILDKTAHSASPILPPASPTAKAIGTSNADAPYAVIVNAMAKPSQAEPSADTAIEDDSDDAQQPKEQDESASSSQNKSAAVPEGESQRGKRNASTISVYQQEKLAKKQAAEEKKKLAAEKKAEAQAAKEAKAKARAEAKEAKQKEKEERKHASSQKAPKVGAKAPLPVPSTPAASASIKASVPIVDDNADSIMSGMADNVPAAAPSSAPAPAPESVALPPSSPVVPAQTPKQTTPGPNLNRSPSEASSPGSASTSRCSQRDSRSPVHFVTANSNAASKDSFPGSGQKQDNDDESESEDGSSSDEEDDNADLDNTSAVKPKTPASTTQEKVDVASSQSVRSTSRIPPPSQPRFSEISAVSKEKTKEQRRQSTTPVQPLAPKIATNRSFGMDGSRASDSPAPSQSQRPAAMAHLPSLKNQAAKALAEKNAALEKIKLEGQVRAKQLHDEQVAKRKEEKVEVSEAETDSSSGDSDSDSDGSSSDSDAKKSTPKNKRLLDLKGGAAPASASKAEGKKKKKIDFGGIKKRFSLGSSLK